MGVGCLGAIGLACLGIALLLVFGRSDPDLRYSGAEDLIASQDFEEVFMDLGIQGVEVIVIPSRGEDGAVLIIKMDESKGFSNIAGAGFDGVLYALTDKIQQGNYDIDYMSLGYIGPEGDLVFTMTTDDETVAAYTSGAITRREFMGNVAVDVEGILEMLDEFDEVAP
jgi:hypothetical protein